MEIKRTLASIQDQQEVTNGITRLMKTVMEHKQKVKNYKSDSFNTQLEDLPGEIWKDVVGFESKYQVSNKGRIKSLRYWQCQQNKWIIRDKILKPALSKCGYCRIHLRDKSRNINNNLPLHRLVAEAFIPIPQELIDRGYSKDDLPVNHIDEIKINNHAENLEWCTHKYNSNYGTAILRNMEMQQIPVTQFDIKGRFIKNWISSRKASETLSICKTSIISAANGWHNSAGGFIWKYTKKEYCEGYTLPSEEIPNVGLNNKDSAKQLDIYDLKTQELVKKCKSFQEASEFLKTSRSNIRKTLRSDGIYRQYLLEFIPKN